MISTYSATLGPGQQWEMDVSGKLFRIIKCDYPVRVLLFSRQGHKGTSDNVGLGFWVKPAETISKVIVVNTSGVAQTVTFIVGAGDAGYDLFQVGGTVSVVDGNRARVDQGMCYAFSQSFSQSAGNYFWAGLIAPSSKKLIVRGITFGAAATSQEFMFGVAAAAEVGTLPSPRTAARKLFGGGDSLTVCRYGNMPNTPGTLGALASYVKCYANDSFVLPLSSPFVVPQNWGFVVASRVVNSGGAVYVEFEEE